MVDPAALRHYVDAGYCVLPAVFSEAQLRPIRARPAKGLYHDNSGADSSTRERLAALWAAFNDPPPLPAPAPLAHRRPGWRMQWTGSPASWWLRAGWTIHTTAPAWIGGWH